jgi:hypothetical protein
VLALNLAVPKDSGRLLGAVATTLAEVFRNVRHVRLSANGPAASVVLFASDAIGSPSLDAVPPALQGVAIEPEPVTVPAGHRRVLTDDYAPMEWLTDLALLEALASPALEQ